ncbi:hypothetical protein H1C71_032472 [Ictidomys tridecemlineatus]|nr:hypothetical protein H1C71_032472 [Ictidomys tridecemlineatus]
MGTGLSDSELSCNQSIMAEKLRMKIWERREKYFTEIPGSQRRANQMDREDKKDRIIHKYTYLKSQECLSPMLQATCVTREARRCLKKNMDFGTRSSGRE